MSFKRTLMLRVMFNHFHHGGPDVLFAPLSKELAKDVLELDVVSQDPAYLLNEPKELVLQTHYSWLAPVINQFSPAMQPLCLIALPRGKAALLSEILKKPLHGTRLAIAARLHLLRKIASKLKPVDVLALPYLPTFTLSPLLRMHKSEIVQLIDFLGLYDLAEEIRHIVDKRYLKAIYNCLSIRKQHFLRMCLHRKERLTIPRLGLEKWQGDCKTLERLLHKRGLLRLGKAIAGAHPDFLWHLVHRLDIGRGRIVQQYYTKEEIPGVTQALIQEILSLFNFFNKNE